MNEMPMIHTSKGNLPVELLIQKVTWHDDEINTIFTESYYFGDELVKQSVHVMAKAGNEASIIASAIG